MHTKEIEQFYMEKQEKMVAELKQNFEAQVSQMRTALENDIMEVGHASQRAVAAEIENFKRHRLPAITSLLSPLNIAHSTNELNNEFVQNQQTTTTQIPVQHSQSKLDRAFDAIDTNNDGVITRAEFAASMLQQQQQLLPQQYAQQMQPTSHLSQSQSQNQIHQMSPFVATPLQPNTQQTPSATSQQQMQRDFEAIMSQLHQNRQNSRAAAKAPSDVSLFAPDHSSHSTYNIPNHDESTISQLQTSLTELSHHGTGGPQEDLLEQNLAKTLHFRSAKQEQDMNRAASSVVHRPEPSQHTRPPQSMGKFNSSLVMSPIQS